MKRHRVDLTADDLARGVPRKARGCAVFRACDRAVGTLVQAVRGDGSIVLRSRRDRYGADAVLSDRDRKLVRAAVEAQDHGFPDLIEPFTFFIEEPA